MAPPRTRRQKPSYTWSWRQLLISAVSVAPLVAVTNLTGVDDWPFWQCLVLAVGLGLVTGMTVLLGQVLWRRKTQGVWSWRQAEANELEQDA